jgi:hypothetical protein
MEELPTGADFTQSLRVGDAQVGEEDFVEL